MTDIEKLKPCAFCGSEAILRCIGNEHTKSRAVQVKCSNSECRIERTDKALRHDMEWLKQVAIKNWNRRSDGAAGTVERDAARLDWLDRQIAEKGSVWLLPSGADMRFIQVRSAGHTDNCPTVQGTVREAIDAAIEAHTEAKGPQ